MVRKIKRKPRPMNGHGKTKEPPAADLPDINVRVEGDRVVLNVSRPVSGDVPFLGDAAIALGSLLIQCGAVAQSIALGQVQVADPPVPAA